MLRPGAAALQPAAKRPRGAAGPAAGADALRGAEGSAVIDLTGDSDSEGTGGPPAQQPAAAPDPPSPPAGPSGRGGAVQQQQQQQQRAVAPIFGAPRPAEAAPPEGQFVDLGGGSWLRLWRRWRPSSAADREVMWQRCPTERVRILMHGRPVALPRFQITYGGAGYRYSGQTTTPEPFPADVQALREAVARATGSPFNMCLVNYYTDGTQYIGPHSDDVRQLAPGSSVAGLSWGAGRRFLLRPRSALAGDASLRKWEGELRDGDLVVMGGRCQHTHTHEVPKAAGKVGRRVSFTFRIFSDSGNAAEQAR